MQKEKTQKFIDLYEKQPCLFFSPGRINLIGEHVDYNEGKVLPAAIDKGIYVYIAANKSSKIRLYSEAFLENIECEIGQLPSKGNGQWYDYIYGVVVELISCGKTIEGFDLLIDGDIPIGSGLSSSAAVECATVYALNSIFELNLSKLEMVKITQKAEHNFARVNCGIMDMFASMFGKKDHVIKLDCKTLEYEYLPINLEGYELVLFNSNIKHSLASSAYNERRNQCENGVAFLKNKGLSAGSLRDVTISDLDKYALEMDPEVYRKSSFVVKEMMRLERFCELLSINNVSELGKVLLETHKGLSEDYEVSCKELDLLIKLVDNNPNVMGGRMMGGGFGGCTINIVKENEVQSIINLVSENYFIKTGIKCDTYIVKTGNGTHQINL